MSSSGPHDWIGQTLANRYHVTEKIGAGGMGTVFKASDTRLGAEVVVKAPHPMMIKDAEFAARFKREIQSLVKLSHPNIVKVMDVGEHDGLPFAVMQYLGGGSLEDRSLPCTPEEVSAWLPDAAAALDFMHSEGLIHRDIKPGNILFDLSGRAYLGDFGIAKVMAEGDEADDKLTGTGSMIGTASYMAPEMLVPSKYKEAYNQRADQYSLAVTVYEVLSGRAPFEGETMAEVAVLLVTTKADLLHEVNPAISEEVARVVARALRKKPEARFGSCQEFANSFGAAVGGEPLPPGGGDRPAKRGSSASGTVPRQPTQVEATRAPEILRTATMQEPVSGPSRRPTMLEPVNSPELPGTGPDRGDTVRSPKRKEQGDSTIAERELPRSQHVSKTPGAFTARGFMIAAVVVLPALVLLGFMLVGGDEDEVVPVRPPAPRASRRGDAVLRSGTMPPLPKPVSEPNVPGGMEVTNSIGMKLRLIRAGEFTMGSPGTESYRGDDETQHRVSITKPFYLGVTEVTQEQYQKVMGTNPSEFKGPQNPVETVSWAAAVEFCRKLSAMPAEKTAGHVYRLPTEAEWEYACRSGTTTAYGFGDDASRLGDYGWLAYNSDSSTHPVSEKKPNAWGLYDMHGGVYEWCQDWYGAYPSGSATDPTGATSGSARVCRGGGWFSSARDCLSAFRVRSSPEFRDYDLGFRVLRSSIGSAAGGGVKSGERSRSVGPSGASGAATRGAGVQAATNSIGMKLRLIPTGEFTMGSPGTESGRFDDETQHRVSITKAFYLGVTEVTQEQYQKVMGTNPSQFQGPQNPVEKVSWAEAVEFCGKLSAMPVEKTAGHVYRLPTEAEWEYACRSGTTTAYGFGDDGSRLGDYGWWGGNSDSKTHPVGEKKPNAWGLYDMHGNVHEWCQDWYGAYPSGSATDPTGATSGSFRVFRGGSWRDIAWSCRSAYRYRFSPGIRFYHLGFRVLRSSIK